MTRRPLALLALALATAAAAVTVWFGAFVIPGGRSLDASAMQAFTGVADAPLTPRIQGLAVLADPAPFLLGGALIVLVALARRRWFMAALVPVILLGANICTQLLKPALADLRIIDLHGIQEIYPGSWPSGHSTASMSLALCLVLVVGPRLRSLAAVVGAAYAITVGYALVALGWHLPSDVLGGYLVAATFALLGAAALAALEGRREPSDMRVRPPAPIGGRALTALVATLLCAAGLAAVVRAPGVTADALAHPTAVIAGLAIAALGLALTAGLAVALRS